MAYEKLTDRTELTTPATTDLVHAVDVSDTGTDAAGNSKKLTIANLMTLAPVQSVNGDTGSVEVQQFKIYAKANEAITKGQLVMFAGAQGSHILMELCDQGSVGFDPTYVMGVAESTLAIGDFGYAIAEGVLTDLNTSAFTDGDILFSSASTAGAFTTTQPSPPNHAVQVAAVRYAHATQGTLQIRITHLFDTDETPEGSTNLYWTQARFDTALAASDTDDLSEGATNLYYTAARVLAQMAGTSVTIHNDVTSAGSGAIITTAERTKLSGIETGAEVNPTAAEVKTLYESNADTNAYTDTEKTKLSGIAVGAEVNVNADWNATTGDAAILNKPTLVQDLTDLGDTPAGYGTAGQALVTNATATGTEWATISGSGAVDSVNGQTGVVVLDTDDISEGVTNLYYTDARVSSYLSTNKIRANYPVSVKTTSFTLATTDEQTFMDCTSASGISVTIPTGLTRFSEFLFYQGGAGAVTITAGTGVTLRNTSAFTNVTAEQYAIIGLKKVDDSGEVYVLTGERKV